MGEENKNEKNSFIKEKIVRKTEAGKGFRNVIKIIAGAILFGIIAASVFVLTKPTAEKLFGTEPESTTAEVVMIPRDEAVEQMTEREATEESKPEMIESDENETNAEETKSVEKDVTQDEVESTEPIEEVVAGVINSYQYSIDDLNGLWKNLSKLCNDMDPSIVTIRPVDEADDFFAGYGETEDEYSGIVIAETFNEVLILTVGDAVSSDEVSVVWTNGNAQTGYVKKPDSITGLGIISVKKNEMTDTVKAFAKPVVLGNSYAVTRGDLLVALGSPRGVVHSSDYAWASYIDKSAQAVDGTSRLIYMNNYMDSEMGTWILNTNEELIGWVDTANDGTVVMGISDYKSLIERMSNSGDYAYFGIVPSSIPDEIANGTSIRAPKGVYVKEVINGAPAYEAGILPGDIITEIGDEEIHTAAEYSACLDKLQAGDELLVIVYREARGEYRKLEYTITAGKRE